MEQALINEGIPVEEISRLCDVHAAVFREGAPVSDPPRPNASLPSGRSPRTGWSGTLCCRNEGAEPMETRDDLQQRIQKRIQPVVEAAVPVAVGLILAGLLTWPFIWLWWRLSIPR
jgi:hypothetical protein